MERFNALEGGRGLLALLVMLVHFEANYHGKAFLNAENLYYVVDYFFVFSGFLMARIYWTGLKTRTDLVEYMIVRFGRVYPLHLVWLMLFIGFEAFRMLLPAAWLDSAPFSGSNDAAAIPLHLLLLQAMGIADKNTWNFPSWSISTEFYSYIVFALLIVIFQRARLLMAFLIVLGCCLALNVWSDIGFQETFKLGFFRCLASFMVGVMIYPLYQRTVEHLKPRYALMSVLELLFFALFLGFSVIADDKLLSFLTPLLAGLLIWSLTYDAGWLSRVFSTRIPLYLGSISYSMYLAHVFVQDRILNLFKLLEIKGLGVFFVADSNNISVTAETLLGTSPWIADALSVLMILLIIAISHFTFLWVEEPARQWAKQLIKNGRKKRAAAVGP